MTVDMTTALRRLLPLIAIAAIVLATGTAMAAMQRPPATGWPVLRAETPPNPEDVKAIEAVVTQALDLEGWAARNFDLSKFPTVYADDPAVPLSDDAVDLLLRTGAAPEESARTFGFLSYKLAFFGNWKLGADAFQRLEQQAAAEGRLITAEELAGISKGGQVPAPARTDPMYFAKVKVEKIVVDGKRAEIVYDDGGVTYLSAMLKTADGWRIVGQRILDLHV